MTTTQNIDSEAVGEFLTNLYGLTISATEHAGACDSFGALATYVDGTGEVRGQILCDLEAGAKLGAALVQIPMGAVDDAVESKSIPDNLLENLKEVLNIAVNVFPGQSERLVLQDVFVEDPGSELPNKSFLKLDIQRYGSCVIGILTAD